MTRHALSIAALSLALALPVLAQGPDRPGRPGGPGAFGGPRGQGRPGGPGGPGGPLSLLMMPEVQRELKLQDAQLSLLGELRPGRPGQGGPPPGAGGPGGERRGPGEGRRNGPPAGGRQEMEQKLAEILDTGQLDRLHQLELQRAGGRALQRKDLADTLQLTDDQRRQVQETVDAEREAMRAAFEASGDGGPGGARGKGREIRKATDAKLDAVLTDAQRQKFQALQGAAFTFPEPRMGPPGGGRGPERRPGGEQ